MANRRRSKKSKIPKKITIQSHVNLKNRRKKLAMVHMYVLTLCHTVSKNSVHKTCSETNWHPKKHCVLKTSLVVGFFFEGLLRWKRLQCSQNLFLFQINLCTIVAFYIPLQCTKNLFGIVLSQRLSCAESQQVRNQSFFVIHSLSYEPFLSSIFLLFDGLYSLFDVEV
jgi:hypothetical protein